MEKTWVDEEMQRVTAELHVQAECVGDYYSCAEAVRRLNEYLDHELTPEERAVVLKHLEICKPCLRRFTFEQTLIVSLRQKIIRLAAPAPLREKLHGLLRQDKKP